MKAGKRNICILSVLCICVLCMVAWWLSYQSQRDSNRQRLNLPINSTLGGDFILPSTLGKPLDSAHLRGKVVLMTFGYADCEDVCPIGLMRLHEVIQALGKDASQVSIIFVAFDSSSDVKHLADYIHGFDPAIIGLTGTATEIAQLSKRYGVIYPEVQNAKGTTRFEHNGYIYLLDQQGRIRALYQNRTPVSEIIKDIGFLAQSP
ncbi:MAG: SCO family protein [Acinetobacter sp.]